MTASVEEQRGPVDRPGRRADGRALRHLRGRGLDERDCIDLGSLLSRPAGPMELRLQVDEESGAGDRCRAGRRGGCARAARVRRLPRWRRLGRAASAHLRRDGADGRHGRPSRRAASAPSCSAWCRCRTPDGQPGTQASRIVAHEGPHWLLRATLMGRPAVEPGQAGPWEETIRQVVVRRGREAMAPGAPRCRSTLPPEARARRLNRRSARPVTDYASSMSEHKSRLRASISRWANQDREEARELRKDTREGRPGRHRARRPTGEKVVVQGTLKTVTLRPRGGVPALEAELYDGSGLDQRGVARAPPHRRHRARARHPGRGPDRRPGRRSG